jgi:DNA-binding transcriptional LysR family regulator
MDRFDAMHAFARVVEAGSFTKADDAETSLSNASAAPRGRLRVDVPSPLARMILVPAFAAFHARYPDIQLQMGVSDRVVDVIGENVDCVVRGGELTNPSLIARRVGELQFDVCAAPSYLERAGTPLHPRELQDTHHRIVGFLWARTGQALSYTMHRDGERIEMQGRYALSVDDGNAYLAAGLAGLGILSLPHYMAVAHLARGELVPLFSAWRLDAMPMYVAFPPNRHVSAKLRVFIDWIAELMAQHAPLARPT